MLLAFSAVLLLAVLLSSLARRTVLSTAVLFLVAGIVLGNLGVLSVTPDDAIVERVAQYALFAVLFTDGMKLGWRDLASAWRLPGRALVVGLPITLLVTAAAAHWLVGLDWLPALLLGAVLSPTDPVFASALVGNERVPGRLRHLLNVESGVNDGLALPFVLVLLALATEEESLHLGELGLELLLGVVVGVLLPLAALWLERTRLFEADGLYAPINAIAIGLLVYALCEVIHANLFLAAFSAGITVATYGPRQREAFHQVGEIGAEVLKLAALLLFGALMTGALVGSVSWQGWFFVAFALVVARPVAIWIAFLGVDIGWREQAALSWFGPKGFASVVYGLIVLHGDFGEAQTVFALVAVTVAASMVAHSSSDVLVARAFDEPHEVPAFAGPDPSEEERPD